MLAWYNCKSAQALHEKRGTLTVMSNLRLQIVNSKSAVEKLAELENEATWHSLAEVFVSFPCQRPWRGPTAGNVGAQSAS